MPLHATCIFGPVPPGTQHFPSGIRRPDQQTRPRRIFKFGARRLETSRCALSGIFSGVLPILPSRFVANGLQRDSVDQSDALLPNGAPCLAVFGVSEGAECSHGRFGNPLLLLDF